MRPSDEARWRAEIAPHPDIVQFVQAGRLTLKAAARHARERVRDDEHTAHNALLEAQDEESWRQAPMMTCPNGHAAKCADCAHAYRFPPEGTEPQ